MSGFSQEFIEKVKLANNIVSVAGRYMMLKQKGRQHWACCPFHHEKTPSFAINEQEQFYKCFGCGVGGNVITLVRQLENVDFVGAIELLAKWSGIKMPEVINDPQYAEKARKKQRILEIIETAREYYCSHLNGAALDYLYKRGITDELIKLFNIGLSPDWDSVISHLKKKGYSEQDIIDSGIAAKSEKGKVYDAMGGRITFAIFDIYGSCIGFTGRIQPSNDNGEVAKYRNTSQTMVFDKGNIVYGLDVLKKNKLSNFVEKLIVVEGNVDVISLVGAGFKNTVACMGTAMTQYHARIFKRFSNQIYICFDGDTAGQKAAIRSLDILSGEGLSVRVIELPKDTDPDGFIKANGKEAFQKLIDSAKPLIDFRLDYLAKHSNLKDNLGKTEYLKAAGEILKTLSGTPELELYVPKVANIAGVSQESILRALGVKTAVKPVEPVPQIQPNTKNAYQTALDFVIASKLYKKSYASQPLDFEIANKLYADIVDKRISDLYDMLAKDDLEAIDHLINYNLSESEDTLAKLYRDSVQCLLKHDTEKKCDELARLADKNNDMQEKIKIAAQIQALKKRLKNG